MSVFVTTWIFTALPRFQRVALPMVSAREAFYNLHSQERVPGIDCHFFDLLATIAIQNNGIIFARYENAENIVLLYFGCPHSKAVCCDRTIIGTDVRAIRALPRFSQLKTILETYDSLYAFSFFLP